jgi:hypothetical protein
MRALAVLFLVGTAHAAAPPRFSHATHARLPFYATDADHLPCASCHALDRSTGDALAPGAQAHQPCADARCHGARMAAVAAAPSLCKECHERAERWSVSPARLQPRAPGDREYGGRINHRRHSTVPGLDRCDVCHRLTKTGPADVAVHRPGHADCMPCHNQEGSSPSLLRCNSCHVAGELERPRPHGGALAPWRVVEKFHHETHRLDVRTARARPGASGRGWSRFDPSTAAPLGCGACHRPAASAERLADMDLLGPCAMEKTCMGQCHDGRLAFQGSGNLKDCLLCHSGVDERTPAPVRRCGK